MIDDVERLERKYRDIIKTYFTDVGISLPRNFKLHCTELKRGRSSPYDQLTRKKRKELLLKIYTTLNSFDCKYISASINIEKHCRKYQERAVNPKGYALWIGYEMIRTMEESIGMKFQIIFEEYYQTKDAMIHAHQTLRSFPNFPNPHNLDDISQHITSGSPQRYPILQFSDFIANSVFSCLVGKQKMEQRLDNEKFWHNINGNSFNSFRII